MPAMIKQNYPGSLKVEIKCIFHVEEGFQSKIRMPSLHTLIYKFLCA